MTHARSTPYLFLLPALAATAAIVLWPVAQTAWMSLHDVVLFRPFDRPFIAFANFARALRDEVFWLSLGQSLLWIVAVVGLQFALGFVAALILNQYFFWRGLARALIVVPWALPSVIIGLMFTWMYDFNLGVVNDIALRLGLIAAPVPWLAQPQTAFWAVVVALVWQGFPFFAVTVLAGLATIPDELIEAGEIDGATRLQRLRHIVIPGIAEIVATALLLRTIWVANSFDVILVMTGGGPGYATHTLPLYAFQKAYSSMEFGYAAALALILTGLLLIVVVAHVRRSARTIER
jgi:multiple sugar transport system permease protein